MPAAAPSLASMIAGEIAARGPIPFARFMELCLYHPRFGYYARGLGGGGGRDYVTSSGLHRAYGALLARQVEEMWRRLGRPDPFLFVEFGPGEGFFAADFLHEAGRREGFARALRYLLVETSPVLAARQKARLAGRAAGRAAWVTDEEIETRAGFTGCLFANEVLDAFPVHRVVGTADGPREIHVALRDGRLAEEILPLSSAAVTRFLAEAGIDPEPGQEVDLNLAAPCWLSWALGLLRRGYALIVDYGHESGALYHPARRRGTLLAYHRHRVHEEFLLQPGEQDLTAHVDFTALRRAAEAGGARCLGAVSQARFLLALGALEFLQEAPDPDAAPAVAGASVERLREREALKELILPDRMGEKFTVLLFGVGDVPRDLAGLREPWSRPRDAAFPRQERAAAGPAGEDRHG
jgi:SAM-dependent MidA family methyltransferase